MSVLGVELALAFIVTVSVILIYFTHREEKKAQKDVKNVIKKERREKDKEQQLRKNSKQDEETLGYVDYEENKGQTEQEDEDLTEIEQHTEEKLENGSTLKENAQREDRENLLHNMKEREETKKYRDLIDNREETEEKLDSTKLLENKKTEEKPENGSTLKENEQRDDNDNNIEEKKIQHSGMAEKIERRNDDAVSE